MLMPFAAGAIKEYF